MWDYFNVWLGIELCWKYGPCKKNVFVSEKAELTQICIHPVWVTNVWGVERGVLFCTFVQERWENPKTQHDRLNTDTEAENRQFQAQHWHWNQYWPLTTDTAVEHWKVLPSVSDTFPLLILTFFSSFWPPFAPFWVQCGHVSTHLDGETRERKVWTPWGNWEAGNSTAYTGAALGYFVASIVAPLTIQAAGLKKSNQIHMCTGCKFRGCWRVGGSDRVLLSYELDRLGGGGGGGCRWPWCGTCV